MCKHVAAVLYGVGARLDASPELLFKLRGVDESELLASAELHMPLTTSAPAAAKVLDDGDIAAVFGLEMAEQASSGNPADAKRRRAKSSKQRVRTAKKGSRRPYG
jgi:uncharacterized Zn finger protein